MRNRWEVLRYSNIGSHMTGLFNCNGKAAGNAKILDKFTVGYADAVKMGVFTMVYSFLWGEMTREFETVGLMMLAEYGHFKILCVSVHLGSGNRSKLG